jgi:hypothetical protein
MILINHSMRLPLTKSESVELTTIITPRQWSLLCLLFVVRLGDYKVNSSDFYSYRLIGKLTAFFATSGVKVPEHDRGLFHFHCESSSPHLKSRVDLALLKAETLRSILNVDWVSITSKSHTHPSHSQTSRLFTSSLSLGVPVPRTTQCLRDV